MRTGRTHVTTQSIGDVTWPPRCSGKAPERTRRVLNLMRNENVRAKYLGFYPEITQASRRRCALNQCRVLSAWRPAHQLLPHVPYEHPPTSRTLLSPAPTPRLDVSIPPRPKTHMRPALPRVNLKALRGAHAPQMQTTSIKSPITRDGRKL